MKKTIKRIVSLLCMLCLLASVWLPLLPAAPAERAAAIPASVSDEITVTDGSRYVVTVGYDTDAGIPEGAALRVSELTELDEGYVDYLARSAEALGAEEESIQFARALDITLYDPATGEEYQPAGSVSVSITLPDAVLEESGNVSVVHFGEEPEVLPAEVNENAVAFETEGFSVYVVIAHEGNDEVTEARVEFHFIDRYTDQQYLDGIDVTNPTDAAPYNFVNLHGEYQTTQILRSGEALELINDPDSISVTGVEKFFYGWYAVEMKSDTTTFNTTSGKHEGVVRYQWPASPDQIRFEKVMTLTQENGDSLEGVKLHEGDKVKWTVDSVSGTAVIDEEGTAHVYLAPLYEDFYFVNFHKGTRDSDEQLKNSLVERKLVVFGSGTSSSVRIGNVVGESTDPQHMIFTGWEEAIDDGNGGYTYTIYRTVKPEIDEHGDIVYVEEDNVSPPRTGYYIDVDKSGSEVKQRDLYPIFDEARWIYFIRGLTGNGSTYVGASYRLSNDDRSSSDTSAYYYLDNTFFTGDGTTQGHMSRRAGYTMEGWYLFANMDDATGELTNLNSAEDVALKYLDSNNVEHPATINTRAIKLVDANGAIQNIGAWYVSSGGVISQDASGTKLFEVDDSGVIRFYKAMNNMNLYANWVMADNTTYKVVVWKQKVTDSYTVTDTPVDVIEWLAANPNEKAENYPNPVKTYDYVTTFVSGSVPSRTAANLVTGFKGTYTWSEEVNDALVTHTESVGGNTGANLTAQSVMNGLTGFAGEFKGFQYSDTDFGYVTLEPDGTTVYNVYYDRITYTLKFYFARTEISGGQTNYTNQGSFSTYSGSMVSTGNYYVRPNNNNSGNSNNGTYYQLNYDSSRNDWYYTRQSGWSTNNYYMSERTGLNVYTATTTGGTLRWRGTASTNAVSDYNDSSISWSVQLTDINDVSDFCYYPNVGSVVRGNYTYYYYPITANYGQDISALWPDYKMFPFVSGTGRDDQKNRVTSIMLMAGAGAITGTGGGSTVKGKLTIMNEQVLGNLADPDGNFMIIRTGQGRNWRYFIWKEQLEDQDYSSYTYTYTDHDGVTTHTLSGEDAVKPRNGIDYYLQEVVLVRSGSTNTGQHYPAYEGFTWDGTSESDYSGTNYNPIMWYYYTRDVETLTFNVNYPVGAGITYDGKTVESGQAQRSSDMMVGVQFDANLAQYGSSTSAGVTNWFYGVETADGKNTADNALIAPDHYLFGGWFEDATCTVPFNFNSTMPSANKIIYAKWTPETFWVKINPNGGEINRVNQGVGYYYTQLQRLGNVDLPLFLGDYMQFAQYLGASTDYFPGNGNISTNQSTYINADYNETISEYVIPRRFVAMGESAADEYEAAGNEAYYYVNYQLRQTDGIAGVYTHVRSAIYLTDEEISHLYELYKACVNVSLSPQYADQNIGMELLDEDTWRSLYVSSERYRPLNDNEHWTFLGWYKTPDGGTEDSMPYNFADPVVGSFTLTAHWRLDGGYRIEYIPTYTMPDGAVINGSMVSWIDPIDVNMTYADGAATQIYKAPTNLTKFTSATGTQSITDDSVIFRGWALVSATYQTDGLGNVVYDGNGKPVIASTTPLEKNADGVITTYYYPSDPYVVNAANADNDSKLFFQAVYQYKGSSDRQPKITNLRLDANGGYIKAGYGGNLPDLPPWNVYPGLSAVNTTDHMTTVGGDSVPTQILFGDIQSSAAVHLYRYASDAGIVKPDGYNYFKHPEGHFLLGFDKVSNEEDYIADYPADSLIAITRQDNKTIYAVWEPMVYMTFRNETDGPIVISLAPADLNDNASLEIINVREGMYGRTKLTDYSEITLAKAGDPDGKDVMMFAFPKGAEKSIKISGTNTLGPGVALMWDSSLELNGMTHNTKTATGSADAVYYHTTAAEGYHSHTLPCGEADNTQSFSFIESLIVNENPVVVTFTSRDNDYALLLNDNFPDASGLTGITQEKDFDENEVLTSAAPVGAKTFSPISDPNSCPGYEFKGWASTKDATEAEFQGSINDLETFFEVGWTSRVNTVSVNSGNTIQRTLYAVWSEYDETSTVFLFKTVPAPGSQDQAFSFHVKIDAGYTPKSASPVLFSQEGDFTLKHNQYAKLYSEQHTETNPVQVVMTVKIYDATTNLRVNTALGNDPDFTIRAQQSVTNNDGYMSKTEFTVEEQPVTHYNASIRRQTQKEGSGIRLADVVGTETLADPQSVDGTKISWSSVQQQGTVIYTNQRETYDVTVSKTLVSNSSAARLFSYTASYDDNGKIVTLYDASEPFTVQSGTSNTTALKNIPAGVKLTVTEITDADNNYAIETSGTYTSGANSGAAITDVDGSSTDASFVINDLNGNAAVFYNNTLKSYKITMKLVDQDGNPLHAMFALSSNVSSLGTDLYAGNGGVFYTSNKMWADSYTLNQTTSPPGYLTLQNKPVTLSVTGNGITSNNTWVTVSEDGENSYVVTVKNWAQVNITVQKILNDALLSGQMSFSFDYSYTSAVDGTSVSGTFSLMPTANKPAGESRTINVPIRSTGLSISETGNESYNTTVAFSGNDHPVISGLVCSYGTDQVLNPGTVTFTNTRKTVEVTVKKVVEDEDKSGSFGFTATLLNGDTPIKDYPIFIGMPLDPSDDELTSSVDGTHNFTLTNYDLASDNAHTLKIPVGARLQIEETGVTGTTMSLDDYATAVEAVYTEGGAVHTGSAETRLFAPTAAFSRDITVTFTNGPAGVDVMFKKIDGFGNPLGGAQFTLYQNYSYDSVNKTGTCSDPTAYVGEASSASGTIGQVTFSQKIPNGVYYMKETPAYPTDSDGVTWSSSNTYILLVGDAALRKEDSALDAAAKAYLTNISGITPGSTSDIGTQADIYKNTFGDDYNKYAIFMIDSSTGKAVTEPDIATFGILNEAEATRRVILRKTDKKSGGKLQMLQGAHFRVFRPDLSEVEPKSGLDFQSLSSGVWFSDELPYGKYYLVETAAPGTPAGYGGNAGRVFVLQVMKDGFFDGGNLAVKQLDVKPGDDQPTYNGSTSEADIIAAFMKWRKDSVTTTP